MRRQLLLREKYEYNEILRGIFLLPSRGRVSTRALNPESGPALQLGVLVSGYLVTNSRLFWLGCNLGSLASVRGLAGGVVPSKQLRRHNTQQNPT